MPTSNSSAGSVSNASAADALDAPGEVADPVIPGQLPLEAAFDEQPAGTADPASDQQEQPFEPPVLDEVAAAAVELARSAAVETAGADAVGEHLSVAVEDHGLVLHTFSCLTPGYRGWAWAVTLARPAEQPEPTVCEVVLLPQADAVLAPEWLPWSQRLAPGDVGPGDELPYRDDDPYLVPGYTVVDEGDEDQERFWELGLGRERVLGPEGVRAAATRWQHGAGGPETELAIQAAAPCSSCGYFVPMSGLLRLDFGVCANEWSPSDGRVVTTDHGCGAHSQTDMELPAPVPLRPIILDESLIDEVDTTFPDEPVPDEPAPGPGIPVPDEPPPGPPDPSPEPGLPDRAPVPELPEPDPEPVLPGFPGLPEPGIAAAETAAPTAAEAEMADAIESSKVESQVEARQVESQPES